MRPNDAEPREDRAVEDEEIEIVEIVGLDEDAPPSSAHEEAVEDDPGAADEIELRFDEEAAPEPEPSRPPDEAERERILRLHADFENTRKRLERERDEAVRNANATVVLRLLAVVDNFERALQHAGSGEESFRDGVFLIYRQLMDELRKEGLKAIDALGETFDPLVHEAVATDPSPDNPPNVVVEELQRGYWFKDRVLRPALVRVSLGRRDDDEPDEAEA